MQRSFSTLLTTLLISTAMLPAAYAQTTGGTHTQSQSLRGKPILYEFAQPFQSGSFGISRLSKMTRVFPAAVR